MLVKKLIFIYLIIASQVVLAYEPDKAHKILTFQALQVYQQCYPDDASYADKKIRQRILQGNIAMDKGLEVGFIERMRLKEEENLFLIKRINNWHFYNKERSHLSKVGLDEQSMSELWQGVHRGLSRNESVFDKALFVGALLHLIEDMTVPAHVVPVYHGPVAIKVLGPFQLSPLVNYMLNEGEFSYLMGNIGPRMIKDSVDSMMPEMQRLQSALVAESFCGELKELPEDPYALRDRQARFTSRQLYEQIDGCDSFIWHTYWLKPKENQYFGRYNIKLDQPFFGQQGRLISGLSICEFSEEDQRYKDFVFQLHLAAIKGDVVLLRWASLQRLR